MKKFLIICMEAGAAESGTGKCEKGISSRLSAGEIPFSPVIKGNKLLPELSVGANDDFTKQHTSPGTGEVCAIYEEGDQFTLNSPFSASTTMGFSDVTSPAMIFFATRVSTLRWINLLSGRAP